MKAILDELVAAEFSVFRERWCVGGDLASVPAHLVDRLRQIHDGVQNAKNHSPPG